MNAGDDLFYLNFFLYSDTTLANIIMALPLHKKGKDCVAMARKTIKEINQGKAKDASVKLDGLKTQGTELAEQTKDLAKRLKEWQEYNRKQEEETQRRIGEYGHREQDLQSKMHGIEANLARQRTILEDKRSHLVQARNALSNAERKRREKEREARHTRTGAVVVGGLLGALTGGIGAAIVGAGFGAGMGQVINDLKQDEEKARKEVGRRRNDCSSAESAITTSQQQISSIQLQISHLSSQLSHMKQQRLKYHEEAGKYREAIVFLQDAVHFWLLFKQLSDHGVDRARLLQKIVDKAESKTDLSLLQRDGSKRVATTFLDTWEELESMSEDEGSQHKFQIEFKCTKCNKHYTNLPYVKQNEVICKHCYDQHALT